MKTVCNRDLCAGCMACISICPVGAVEIEDQLNSYNACINEDKCIDCGACYRVCPVNHPPSFSHPIKWIQGWADADIRQNSSSGGFATSIIKHFIQSGGGVYGCSYEKGSFGFKFVDNEDHIFSFQGSKYVKSDPTGVHREILGKLKQGKKILFIGLPCQVAGVKNYVGSRNQNLYTIDLICHGTPSPKLLEMSIREYGYDFERVENIQFRNKVQFGIIINGIKVTPESVRDRYMMAFLGGLCYTENCYSCSYATVNRISDLTIGDSWGTDLHDQEKYGISIGLCQTQKGIELLENSNLELREVDLEAAIKANHQLQHPTIAPECKETFFSLLASNKRFGFAVKKCYPKACFRQDVKTILSKLGILKLLRRNS